MKPSKTALFNSAKIWDAPACKELLAAAPALAHVRDAKSRTALHLASQVKPGAKGTLEEHGLKTAAALLAGGAELHAVVGLDKGEFQAAPIWYAVAHGDNLPLVKFLIKRGADPSNCLWAAVWNDNAEILREILKTKPPLNRKGEGATAIAAAAGWRRLNALDVLIRAGADPSIKDYKGRTAIDIARARKLPAGIIERMELVKENKAA